MSDLRAIPLVVVLLAAVSAGPAWAQTVLKIGVREDAVPFSYREGSGAPMIDQTQNEQGPLYTAGYRGYVVQLCDMALNALAASRKEEVPIEIVSLSAGTRFGPDALGWNILCDPATLTSERMKAHDPTLPIYLSGIGYASVSPLPKADACNPLVGVAMETTALHAGVEAILNAKAWPRYETRIRAGTSANAVAPTQPANCEGTEPSVVARNTHPELAGMLCDGKILYYAGDLEIVRANLALEAKKRDCAFELSPETYADQRYTIYTRVMDLDEAGRDRLAGFRAELSRLVLADDSALLHAYRTNLVGTRPSRKLAAFYWSIIGRFE